MLDDNDMEAGIKKTVKISGDIKVPGDKSISHRALIFGAIAQGDTTIRNFLHGEDCISTMNVLKSAGVEISSGGGSIIIRGKSGKLREPGNVLDCGNSGTTMRLLAGLLAAQPFYSVLTGDSSLVNRPMARIIEPLSLMGAEVHARDNNRYPPITIKGKKLCPIRYRMAVASAQVKSCIILASLYTDGSTLIEEPNLSRDHTERMLRYFGGNIERKNSLITVSGNQKLTGKEVYVPGDFSSAAYFMAAAFMAEDSRLKINKTGINPTRTGFKDVLIRMGADVKIYGQNEISGEPVGSIEVKGGRRLSGTDIVAGEIPGIIDEIPLIAVVASTAEGRTSISGAGELRVKESDRLEAISSELNKMGARVNVSQDGLTIDGVKRLKGCVVDSRGDHRIAMSLAIAALWAEGTTVIRNFECVKISFPSFPELLAETGCDIRVK